MRVWTPIIPKSVLFIVTNNNAEPSEWSLDVLIKPNEKMVMIILVDVVFLLILGLIIIILHLMEKVRNYSLIKYRLRIGRKSNLMCYFDYTIVN